MRIPRPRVLSCRSSSPRSVGLSVVLSLILLLGWTGGAGAQPSGHSAAPTHAAPTQAAPASCFPSTSAVKKVVDDASGPVARFGAGAVVVAAPLHSDTPAPQGDALVARLVGLLAGTLGPTARAIPKPMALDVARAEAAGSPTLIYLEAEIAQGQLRLTADAYPIARNIWDRARSGAPGPVAHAFGSARIDAEVRTFLTPIALVAAHPLEVPLPSPEVVALACEDLDGDGALDLLVVSRRTLALGRIRDGKFRSFRQIAWRDLSPIAPVPWRQPLATLALGPRGAFDVGLTDRARSVRLDGLLHEIAVYDGMPVPTLASTGCARQRVGSLTAELHPCLPGDPTPSTRADFPFDAAAAMHETDFDGSSRSVWAVRSPTDGLVTLHDNRGQQHTLRNVGAQLALADLDLDGDPDLVASKNVLSARNDALVIRSWRGNGKMDKRAEVAVPDGVRALTICPVDGPGQRTIALATSKELWIFR